MTHWYESDSPGRWGLGIAGWTVAILLFFGAISIAVWGFGVGTSDIQGRGNAIKQKNSATNRIFAQQHFEDAYAAIQKDVANIKVSVAAATADPNQINLTNVTGVKQVCNADVADYNASARKYLEKQFRAADLPPSIDLALCA